MKSISLKNLLTAITDAIASSQHAAREQHHQNLLNHFEDSKEGHKVPKHTPMLLPKDHIEEGEDAHGVANIPHLTLANHDQVHLSELDLDLECVLDWQRCEEDGQSDTLSLLVGAAIPRGARAGVLKLRYKSSEPPEGVAKINDSALKS